MKRIGWMLAAVAVVVVMFFPHRMAATYDDAADGNPSAQLGQPEHHTTAMDSALSCVKSKLRASGRVIRFHVHKDAFKDSAWFGVTNARKMVSMALSKGGILEFTENDKSKCSDAVSHGGSGNATPVGYILQGSILKEGETQSVREKFSTALFRASRFFGVGAQSTVENTDYEAVLDLWTQDFCTEDSIPGRHASNRISIGEQKTVKDLHAGGLLRGNVSYQIERDKSADKATAVRALVERGVVELVGKLAGHGGSCLSAQNDPAANTALAAASPSAGKITLGSSRGPAPLYRIGDAMAFQISASTLTHLYCFYSDSFGSVVQLFPNNYMNDAIVEKGETLPVPSPVMPVELIANSAGNDTLTCYSTRQDVTGQLAERLGTPQLAPFRDRVSPGYLDGLMKELSEGEFTSNRMSITIMENDS